MTILSRLPGVFGALALTAAVAAQCPGNYGGPPSTQASGSSSSGMSPTTPASPAPGTPSGPHPAGPTTPGPGDPGSPGPANSPRGPSAPTTGGPPRGPGSGGVAAGRTGARGAAMTFERGETSKDRLKLDWEHPVPPERGANTSAAGALPLAEALSVLWGDDTRPLLVLRECNLCAGSDLPLLAQSQNNDRTLLMSKWFKIVRLPPHVTDPSHPFHDVFAGFEFLGPAPHFYLLSHPAAQPIAFTGTPTQTHLWRSMSEVVKERYQLDPERALKRWLKLLDKFDTVDAARRLAKEQLRAARADKGPRSPRARSLQARIDDLDLEFAKLIAEEKKVTNLVLVPFPEVAAAEAAGRTPEAVR